MGETQRRKLEALVSEPSDIVYCDANAVGDKCIVAADGLIYPNGEFLDFLVREERRELRCPWQVY